MTHPDQSEQQLRRALSTMNDLQPPTDELFVQRAIVRGRARTYRRRNVLAGAAAAFILVAGGGGVWVLQNGPAGRSATTQAGSAPEAQYDSKAGAPNPAVAPNGPSAPTTPAGVGALGSRDGGLFVGPMTPARAAFESLVPELTTTWASTFSGAWATDETNEHLVVALTQHDSELERWISANVRDASAVEYVLAAHSYADKTALADRIRGEYAALASEGIVVESVAQDYRADRVVIVAHGPAVAQRLADRYGADWVTVTSLAEAPSGKLPDGSTLPTLER